MPTQLFHDAGDRLRAAALGRALGEPAADVLRPLLTGRLARRTRTLDLAIDAVLRETTHELLSRGWRPTELHRFAAKRVDALSLGYLRDTLAATAQWAAAVSWLPELAPLEARVWWTVGDPHLGQWGARNGLRRAEMITVAVEVLALLSYLPRTDELQPDAPTAAAPAPGALVQDPRIVARIDALLARAAGSGFPGEADACARKAQELMVRYATVPEPPAAPHPIPAATAIAVAGAVRRLLAEGPATTAKTVLAGARAGTGIGRSALHDPRRFVAAFGTEATRLLQRATARLVPGQLGPRPRPDRTAHRPLPITGS